MFTLSPINYFVKHDGGSLMEQVRAELLQRGQRTRAFAGALALHMLLAAAVIYLVVPPLPRLEETQPIEIVKLPETPKTEPPKVVPPKPVVKPSPPKAITSPPRPLPPPPIAKVDPAPIIPMPVAPVQETPPAPEPPPRVEAAPATPPAPPPPPAPSKIDEYIAPSSDAAYLHNPAPTYPLIAQRRGWQGITLLEVRVSAQGKPLAVSIKKSSGYAVLDDTARNTVLNSYRFEPARRNGEKVEAAVELPMRFTLN